MFPLLFDEWSSSVIRYHLLHTERITNSTNSENQLLHFSYRKSNFYSERVKNREKGVGILFFGLPSVYSKLLYAAVKIILKLVLFALSLRLW